MRIDSINGNPTAPGGHSSAPAHHLVESPREVRRTTEVEAGSEDAAWGEHREELGDHIDQLNGILRFFDRKLAFELHEGTSRYLVRVVETETEEILREIPPEEVLDMVARIEEMVGLVIDERI